MSELTNKSSVEVKKCANRVILAGAVVDAIEASLKGIDEDVGDGRGGDWVYACGGDVGAVAGTVGVGGCKQEPMALTPGRLVSPRKGRPSSAAATAIAIERPEWWALTAPPGPF